MTPRIQRYAFAAWLEVRRRGVTATNVADLVAGGAKRAAVIRDKTTAPVDPSLICAPWQDDADKHPLDAGIPDNPGWGHALEPALCEWAARKVGIAGACTPLTIAQHPEHTWAICSPDWLAMDPSDGLIEAKARWSAKAIDEWRRGVPRSIELQVRWQMFVLQRPIGYVAVTLGGAPPVIYPIERDAKVEDLLLRLGQQAWTEVQERDGYVDEIQQGNEVPLAATGSSYRAVR